MSDVKRLLTIVSLHTHPGEYGAGCLGCGKRLEEVNRLPAYEAAVEALERMVRAHDERFAPTPDILEKARAALARLRETVPAS